MLTFYTILDRLAVLQLAMAGLAVLGILVTITVDIAMRALFNSAFSSTIEIVSYYYMAPIAILPIATLELKDRHIRTDLFYRLFPQTGRAVSDIIAGCLTVGIYSLLAWVSWKQALTSTTAGELAMGIAMLPIWPVRWIVPFAFAVSAVIALFLMIHPLIMRRHND